MHCPIKSIKHKLEWFVIYHICDDFYLQERPKTAKFPNGDLGVLAVSHVALGNKSESEKLKNIQNLGENRVHHYERSNGVAVLGTAMMDTLTGETSGDTNHDQPETAREMVEHVFQVK